MITKMMRSGHHCPARPLRLNTRARSNGGGGEDKDKELPPLGNTGTGKQTPAAALPPRPRHSFFRSCCCRDEAAVSSTDTGRRGQGKHTSRKWKRDTHWPTGGGNDTIAIGAAACSSSSSAVAPPLRSYGLRGRRHCAAGRSLPIATSLRGPSTPPPLSLTPRVALVPLIGTPILYRGANSLPCR